jgi:type IV pilus assembly protein PilW
MRIALERSASMGRSNWEQQGFTLVELMIGLAIATIIVAAGFTALTGSNKATQINDQTAQAQQNARIAMELLSHDIKMAGFGMMGAVGNCPTAIVPADFSSTGNDTGPDSISVVVPTTSTVAPLWTLDNPGVTGPFTTMPLTPGAVTDMTNAGLGTSGSIVSVGGVMSASVTASGNNLSLGATSVLAPVFFPPGTPVHLLQCITYQVIRATDTNVALCGGNAPCLVRGVAPMVGPKIDCNGTVGTNTCVSIADGIEDLQLAYGCDGCVTTVNGGVADNLVDDQPGGTANAFDCYDFLPNTAGCQGGAAPGTPVHTAVPGGATNDTIRLVRVSIVARQARTDQGFGESNQAAASSPTPLLVEDHLLSSDIGYNNQLRRRVFTRTVETRNLGL